MSRFTALYVDSDEEDESKSPASTSVVFSPSKKSVFEIDLTKYSIIEIRRVEESHWQGKLSNHMPFDAKFFGGRFTFSVYPVGANINLEPKKKLSDVINLIAPKHQFLLHYLSRDLSSMTMTKMLKLTGLYLSTSCKII